MQLNNLTNINTYDASKAAAFMRSRERWGELSNMTRGFPLIVNHTRFQSSEGLYQAFKFPDSPSRQTAIGLAGSGMEAKKVAYQKGNLPVDDWDNLRVNAMCIALAVKLDQHPTKFGNILMKASGLFIVEKSYRDQFWGAHPSGETLTGRNVLGKILNEMAKHLASTNDPKATAANTAAAAQNPALLINGAPVQIQG